MSNGIRQAGAAIAGAITQRKAAKAKEQQNEQFVSSIEESFEEEVPQNISQFLRTKEGKARDVGEITKLIQAQKTFSDLGLADEKQRLTELQIEEEEFERKTRETPEEKADRELLEELTGLGGSAKGLDEIEDRLARRTEIGKRIGVSKAEQKALEDSVKGQKKIVSAVKRFGTIVRQFNEALPANEANAFTQRIKGKFANFGAMTGIIPNAKLLALQKVAELTAIQIIRGFGEVGNLSGSERQSAVQVRDLAGETFEERMATGKNLIEFVVSGMTDQQIDEFILKDKVMVQVLNAFDVDVKTLFEFAGGENSMDVLEAEIASLQRELGLVGEGGQNATAVS